MADQPSVNSACAAPEPNPYQPVRMRIIRRHNLSDDVRFFQVRPVEVEQALRITYNPGQFMMISRFGAGEGPFSISSSPSRPGLLEFGIRRVGVLTEALHKLKENEIIGVRGPYGNGFPLERMKGHDLIVVIGGLGAIPLRSLLLYALDNRDQFGKIYCLYGAKRPGEMLFRRDFFELKKRDDLECLFSVDRDDTGTWTEKIGLVTSLFADVKDINPDNTYAAVCGPPAMYRFVIDELVKRKIPKHQILMTLERRMHCGIGKCGHCIIGSIYTCMDGPIFTYWDVLHMKDLI